MNSTVNILFSGVGGQGIILAGEIMSFALIKAGLDVKKGEVHGMAQRGGSVVAHVRYGEKVYSPLIDHGTADIQMAFEQMESLRYVPFLKKDAKVIINTQKIPPLSVSTGSLDYPPDVVGRLKSKGLSVFPVDALAVAKSLGEVRTVNMVLIGVLSGLLPFDESVYREVIRERVKKQFVDVNILALEKGRELITTTWNTACSH